MISNRVNIKFVDTPADAPNYPASVTLLQIQECIIVGKGTVQGNPAVDIQMTDKNGKKYLIMATGNLIEMIGSSVNGKRKQSYN